MRTVALVLTNGLVAGAVYGLIAVALSLVYKKSRALNFASAEIGMISAFVFYVLHVEQKLSYVVALLIGLIVGAALGAATYAILAPRREDPLAMLIGTLAVSSALIWVAIEVWGANPRFVPPPLTGVSIDVLGARLIGPRLLVLAAAVALGAAAWSIFRFTRAGLIFRASAADPYAAQLVGVNTVVVDVVTWAAAGALAALAAILVAPLVGFHVFFMTLLAIRGFTAALLAGMTSIAGSVVAGLVLGVGESALVRVSPEPGLPEVVLFLGIILVLVLRPVSFGRRTA